MEYFFLKTMHKQKPIINTDTLVLSSVLICYNHSHWASVSSQSHQVFPDLFLLNTTELCTPHDIRINLTYYNQTHHPFLFLHFNHPVIHPHDFPHFLIWSLKQEIVEFLLKQGDYASLGTDFSTADVPKHGSNCKPWLWTIHRRYHYYDTCLSHVNLSMC